MTSKLYFLTFLLAPLLLFNVISATAQSASQNDSLLLVKLYNQTGGNNWNNNENWLSTSLDQWYGVSVNSKTGRVDTLNLKNNNLKGELPEDLYQLDSLKVLVLSYNHLYGNIPEIHRIPAIGSDSIEHEELILYLNNYTFRDIESNSKALQEYLRKTSYFVYTYSGLKRQNLFGDTEYKRVKKGEEVHFDYSFYSGVPGNNYIWYRNNREVDTTEEAYYSIKSFDPDEHSGEWYCRVFRSKNDKDHYQTFSSTHLQDTINESPTLNWRNYKNSSKDKNLNNEQIRLSDSAFTAIQFRINDDFKANKKTFKVVSYPENIRLVFGELTDVDIPEEFEPIPLFKDTTSIYSFINIIPRRKEKGWVGRDSLVVEACDFEGGCSRSAFYFTSTEQFTPEAPNRDKFKFKIADDGTVRVSWDSVSSGVDSYTFVVYSRESSDCSFELSEKKLDSVEFSATPGTYVFPNKILRDTLDAKYLTIYIYAENEAGLSNKTFFSEFFPPEYPEYIFTSTLLDDNNVWLKWEMEDDCYLNNRLYQKVNESKFAATDKRVRVKDSVQYSLSPGKHYAFFIKSYNSDSLFTISNTTTDTIYINVPDKAPEVISDLNWVFQKRFTRFKKDLIRDDIDEELIWEFYPADHFIVSQTGKDLSLELKDSDWTGTDTLNFRVADLKGNKLDTFAVVNVETSNTPPGFITPALTFPVDCQIKNELRLKNFVNEQETDKKHLKYYISESGIAEARLEGSVLYFVIPVNENGSTAIKVVVEDEGLATDTMTVNVQYASRENSAPEINLAEEVFKMLHTATYVSEGYEPIYLPNHVTDDGPVNDLSWSLSGIDSKHVDRIKKKLNLTIKNDSFYIEPKPDANFSLMDYYRTPFNPGESFKFWLKAEDLSGAKDSVKITLIMGEKFPVIKNVPFKHIYIGDTLEFNFLDYLQLSDKHNLNDFIFSANGDIAVSASIDSLYNVKVTADPIFVNSLESHFSIYLVYLKQTMNDVVGFRFPVIVHMRQNLPPKLRPIPIQQFKNSNKISLELSEYLEDELPSTHLFWYTEGEEHVTVDIDNGVLTAEKINPSGTFGRDTVSLVVEDLEYQRDTVLMVFADEVENYAPIISDIPAKWISMGESFSDLELSEFVTDDNTRPEDITWLAEAGEHLEVSLSGSLSSVVVKNSNWNGTDSIRYIATDEGGLKDTILVHYTVDYVNSTTPLSTCEVNVWPNPSRGSINIGLCESLSNGTVSISLTDGDGKVLHKDQVQGKNQYHLKTRGLSGGTYHLIIENTNNRMIKVEPIILIN